MLKSTYIIIILLWSGEEYLKGGNIIKVSLKYELDF